ncbi:MAG: 3'(2'),5'-bisphosphate nucleotidase CysQ [Alphaproteobacteria bacterium]|nr:3'(2'),5'-bisphosphate nucleotidase CysQ [Alphaproteobacteria bacterium]
MNPQRTFTIATRRALLTHLVNIAREAGSVIMQHYATHTTARQKADNSPVTAADEAAEELILRHLGELEPSIPVIAEERTAAGALPNISAGTFFLVDPLDGTKEFLSHNGEFTVNIALIENGQPTAGVVFAPAIDRMFWGSDNAAFEQTIAIGHIGKIETRPAPAQGLVAIASRSHRDSSTEDFLARFQIEQVVSAGSSLKFCLIAAGEADIYPRLGRTMEWDTAAGDAILRAAGGRVTHLDGTTPMTYGNTADAFANPHFVAWGR